jgi:hypothetical protein
LQVVEGGREGSSVFLLPHADKAVIMTCKEMEMGAVAVETSAVDSSVVDSSADVEAAAAPAIAGPSNS